MLRWRLALLVSAAFAISDLDRQTRPVAIKAIAQDIPRMWSTLVMILPADMYPRNAIGAVAGLVGFGAAMGGVLFGQLVGTLLDRGFGYGIVFALAGSFHVLAFLVLCATIPVTRPVSLPSPRSASRSPVSP